ncbi:MAG: 4,5-DOPA dioxygenase extradiol [Deltaproteobacteria bacterium]|nr:MAG: 4,5-DOPA dioxygenase extradiol [Deltaproteobacteria bacterium]
MPAAFIGHGSPMNTLEANRYTASWRRLGQAVPKPRAVLMVSAHWYIGVTAVTTMRKPRTIHDFYGFPQTLAEFQYPAPGAPEVAGEVIEVVKPLWCGPDHDSWGLDHGAWSVLAHVFPDADVPVLQLSVNATKEPAYHFELATRLAPLRDRGVLILASGNVVHSLREVSFRMRGEGFGWAHRFDEAAREALVTAPEEVLRLHEHPDYRRAVPTPDHFLPLVTLAGLAAAAGTPAGVLVDGYDLGSMSMTSYGLDVACPGPDDDTDAAALPDPDVCPTAQTNS